MRPIAPRALLPLSLAAWLFSSSVQAAEPARPETPVQARADAGDVAAQYAMARHYGGVTGAAFDPAKSLDYTRRAARNGHTRAQVDLAFVYFNGSDLLPKDPRQSAAWFGKAAASGSVIAQCMLGDFYRSGWGGLPKDPARAMGYYRETATKTDRCAAKSQYALYVGYAAGVGAKRDLAVATRWLKRSAEAGNPQAQATLGRNFLTGHGVPKNEEAGMDWIRRSREGVAPHDEVHDEHEHR